MTKYLLTGGGTAGHVNPLLSLADLISKKEPESTVIALGTKEGLEANLVPGRGYELLTIEKLPFPRRPNGYAIKFPIKFFSAVASVRKIIKSRGIDVVVGFGGYASAPAYVAAKLERKKLVIHEANALPGIANKIGSKLATITAVAFANTKLKNAVHIGMPLREEIEAIIAKKEPAKARAHFGLELDRLTLLVTGGSLGAKSINDTIEASRDLLEAAGIQVFHIVGGKSELEPIKEKGYLRIRYCDRMDLAIAAADFAVSRAGSATVAEFTAVGLPALFIPYPVGNGEQRHNIEEVVRLGGAISVPDRNFNREYVASFLVPMLSSAKVLREMAAGSRKAGKLGATLALYELVKGVLS